MQIDRQSAKLEMAERVAESSDRKQTLDAVTGARLDKSLGALVMSMDQSRADSLETQMQTQMQTDAAMRDLAARFRA